MTREQFNEVADKAISALQSCVTQDDKSAQIIAQHFYDEIKRINKKVDGELEWALESPPAADGNRQLFKNEDCANTRYTPPDGSDDLPSLPQTNGPPPTQAPYAEGICTLKLRQTTTEKTPVTQEYSLEAQILDSKGNSIAAGDPDTATATHPWLYSSKLEAMLEMTPSKDHDGMVYFNIGEQSWDTNTNDAAKIPHCVRSDEQRTKGGLRQKDHECPFVCMWGGGKSSDGTN